MTRLQRWKHWRAIIEKQPISGMSIAAYCRENRIRPSHFYKWRRRLIEQRPSAGGFLELIPGGMPESVPSGISIRLGGKLAVNVERDFDPRTLRAVVETLRGLSSCLA